MESSKPIRLKVITPEKTVYDEMVNHVVLPAQEGEMGIFHNHTPFMSYLKVGRLHIYLQNMNMINLTINSGLIEFKDDLLTLLTTEDVSEESFQPGGEEEKGIA